MLAFSPNSTIGRLLLLRTLAIVAQLLAVIFSQYWLQSQVDMLPALGVIAIASLFQLASVYAYRKQSEADVAGMIMQLAADVVLLTLLLGFTGGASNAFVSLLILPIVIAAITLRRRYALFIAVLAVLSYSWLLWRLPSQAHHHDMTGHFQAMWVNFVFSAAIIVWVVTALAEKIASKERSLAKARERQLHDEQVMALGASAAQVAHQLATPLANLHLLYEEFQEELPDSSLIKEFAEPLAQCQQLLEQFRHQSQLLQGQKHQAKITHHAVLAQLQELLLLEYPAIAVQVVDKVPAVELDYDPMLLPALHNIVNNGARASKDNNVPKLLLRSQMQNNQWLLQVEDFGTGLSAEQLQQVGNKPQSSQYGFGLGLLLTHATLNRLGGSFTIANLATGAQVSVRLPAQLKEQK
ncbi:ATP-binding protein [Pseudoalteromonas fenneropenaei]|uniref:histidine kinase n=1 Tax=Pseudoalteromonas fenneropenaei TaxID=1737459 RepID=A0ABV7CQ37_9GAMM